MIDDVCDVNIEIIDVIEVVEIDLVVGEVGDLVIEVFDIDFVMEFIV